jgi:hypothetical protein
MSHLIPTVRRDPRNRIYNYLKKPGETMKAIIRTIATIAMITLAAPAFAGGINVYDDGDSKLKLEGKFFLNSTYNNKEKTVLGITSTTNQTIGLAVDRAYFGAKYYFNNDWMVRITTDVHLDTGLAKKNNNIFLKYAYVQGKLIGDGLVLRLGQSHTPWIDYEQHLWKHRYVSKVFVDQYGFDSSSDLGIGLKGKLADGLVKYWVVGVAGAGYSHPGMHKDALTGKYSSGVKAVDLNARVGIYPVKGLTLDFQIRDGFKGTKYFDKANSQTAPGTKHSLYQIMASYGTGHDWRVGANYIHEKADRRTDILNGLTARNDKTNGYSAWAWYNIPDTKFGVFGRFDKKDITRNGVATKDKTNHYVGGLEYSPVKNVTFATVFDYTKVTDAKFALGTDTKSTKAGLYTQIKF